MQVQYHDYDMLIFQTEGNFYDIELCGIIVYGHFLLRGIQWMGQSEQKRYR